MEFFGAGRTFVAALDRAGPHLWMVLTDPDDRDRVIEALKNRGLSLEADLSVTLLERVRNGLLESSRTIHVVKDECRTRLGLPIPDPAQPPSGPE